MIYDYFIVGPHSDSGPVKLIWLPPSKRQSNDSNKNTKRNDDYIGLAQACRQTRTEFSLKYYRETVFEIRLRDISKFCTLLIKNHLSAPKILNISFNPGNVSPDRVSPDRLDRCRDVDILPLLKFKRRIAEGEIRFIWPRSKFTEDFQATSVSRLYENSSEEWQSLLNRQVFSQIRVGGWGYVSLIVSLTKWPGVSTEHPWMRKIPPRPPGTYLEKLNLQGLNLEFRMTE
jgi:hypothetical protein